MALLVSRKPIFVGHPANSTSVIRCLSSNKNKNIKERVKMIKTDVRIFAQKISATPKSSGWQKKYNNEFIKDFKQFGISPRGFGVSCLRTWITKRPKSPVRIFIRHMWLRKSLVEKKETIITTTTTIPKRNFFTVFFVDKKKTWVTKKPEVTNIASDIANANSLTIDPAAQKETAFIKKCVLPYKLPKKEVFKKPYGQGHPTVVPNPVLTLLYYGQDPSRLWPPSITLTHTVPTEECQYKHGFRVIAWVRLSDDPVTKKPQYAILTTNARTLADMIKAGPSDVITERYITNLDKTQNEENIKKLKYLYEVYTAYQDFFQNQKNSKLYINKILQNDVLEIKEVDILLEKKIEIVESLMSINKNMLYLPIKLTSKEPQEQPVENEAIMRNNKESMRNDKEHMRPKFIKKKFIPPEESANQSNQHIFRPKKKMYLKSENGRFVKYKNGKHFRYKGESNLKKVNYSHARRNIGFSQKNESTTTDSDDEISN